MNMQNITGKNIKVSARSITVLNEAGKTAGVVTNVKTFYTLYSSRQIFDLAQAIKKAGIDRYDIDWLRMFEVGGQWYYVENMSANEQYIHFGDERAIEKSRRNKRAAEQFGAIVITVNNVYDTRGF